MKNSLSLVLKTCAAGALALVLSASASAGVVFRGAIDPIFGVFIPGASFTGEAFFDVSADCLDVSMDGTHDPTGDTCGGMSLLSATITLVNGSNSQTLTFWDSSSAGQPVLDFLIDNGTLGAVDTIDIGPQFVASSPSIGYVGPMWLNLGHVGVVGEGLEATAQLFTGSCFEGCFPSHDPATSSNVATVTITQVPEPATVALILAAMTVGWIVRRKGVGQR